MERFLFKFISYKSGLVALFYLLSGCMSLNGSTEIKLHFAGTKALQLDSVTAFTKTQLHYVKTDTGNYIAFLNALTNSIYLYADNNSKEYTTINLQTEGPNAVGNIFDFLYHSDDSIFVFNQQQNKLYLIDRQCNVLSKYKPQADIVYYATLPSDYSPIRLDNNKLFLDVIYPNSNDHPIHLQVDLQTDSLLYFGYYPIAYYYQPETILPTYFYMAHCINSSSKQIVYSFPHSDSVYVSAFDHPEQSKAYYAASKNIGKIEPRYSGDWTETEKLRATTSRYIKMLYDPYRKLYYRIARVGMTDEEYVQSTRDNELARPLEIVILNENLTYVGELSLPGDTYWAYKSFVNEQGLCITNYAESMKNEDYWVFDIYTVER